MSISKRLYMNFGAVLAMVIVLFLVNLIAVQPGAQRERGGIADAGNEDQHQQRPFSDHAEPPLPRQLSVERRQPGSGADERRGSPAAATTCRRARKLASSDQQRSALETAQKNESAWVTEFAQPMLQKRREVDAGNATVADLQIYYLQKDAAFLGEDFDRRVERLPTRKRTQILDERRKIG